MKEQIKEWGNVILRAAIIIALLYFCCWPVRLQGVSMQPTYQNGDVVFLSRCAGKFFGYQTGDLVLFPYENQTIIKRIIAMDGDHVQVIDGSVFVNGELLQEPYVQGTTIGVVDFVIPENCVFVLGDNREQSIDSRQMGAISEQDLYGKVLFSL